MKPTPIPPSDPAPLLTFGAHPDDIEFGCGAVVARETQGGRRAHFVICSKGEAGTRGTPAQRVREARAAAGILGATVEFLQFDGDAHLDVKTAHAIKLARVIRRTRPGVVLAPSLVENQHPDHSKLGRLVRDAARLARYGGLQALRTLAPHAVGQLFFYAVTADAEPTDQAKILIDVSTPAVVDAWTAAMRAHASQMATRNYVELQLARAQVNGLRAGVERAIPLFANDTLVFDSLATLGRAARQF
ncbi:MAG TPA: PIG-L family deacetylase [Opitutus sp.]|nr:PIG-L family deacetylase [Opitutus sp.]